MKRVTYDETKWKLVPLEATEEMLVEGTKHYIYPDREDPEKDVLERRITARVYQTMIRRSPEYK